MGCPLGGHFCFRSIQGGSRTAFLARTAVGDAGFVCVLALFVQKRPHMGPRNHAHETTHGATKPHMGHETTHMGPRNPRGSQLRGGRSPQPLPRPPGPWAEGARAKKKGCIRNTVGGWQSTASACLKVGFKNVRLGHKRGPPFAALLMQSRGPGGTRGPKGRLCSRGFSRNRLHSRAF